MAKTIAELNDLLADIENDLSERKESLASSAKDKVGQAICAYANDLPNHRAAGVVFVGANDKGNIVSTPITDRLLLDLAAFRSDGNILPLPQITVRKLELTGANGTRGDVAVMEVEPSPSPPVRYKAQVWIRVGPRRATASSDEERALSEKRRWRDVPFDQRPLSSSQLSDIDATLFERVYLPSAIDPEVLAQNQRSREQQLASLRLYSLSEDRPTVAGLLVVGKLPRDFISGSYIQFTRHEGTEIIAPITDQKEISGPLPDLVRQLDEVLKANIRVATDLVSSDTETRAPDYPLSALQQLTRNALMHRNYETSNAPIRLLWFSDRIEIHSPGGPFGQVTKENFGRPGVTDYRNATLAEAMKNLGFVQRFGVGIATAQNLLLQNNNPPALFQVESNYILTTIETRRATPRVIP